MKNKKTVNRLYTRIAPRKELTAQGLFKILDRDKHYARFYKGLKSCMELVDISTTGCAFKVDSFIPEGAYLEIEIVKFSEEHVFDEPIVAACETVYCHYVNRAQNKVGAKFLEINHGDVEKIRKYTE